ncbi:MAG: hypothetical protein WCN88_04770 [Candidatus Falkowbacteria bacterium]
MSIQKIQIEISKDKLKNKLGIVSGKNGKDGKNGRDGRDGLNGKNGVDGKNGKNGIGLIGLTGLDGINGKDGKDGVNPDVKDVVENIKKLKGNDRIPASSIKDLPTQVRSWFGNSGLATVITDNTITGKGTTDNPLHAALDSYAKLSISVTMDELLNAITGLKATSQLIPNQWYKITDYQTLSFIAGTNVLYTAPVEQIYVQALDVNQIGQKGFSATYTDEEIKFTTVVSALTEEISYANESGYDSSNITTTGYGTDWFSVSETGPYSQDYFYLEGYDGDTDVSFYADQSTLNIDFTFENGIFTWINNPGVSFESIFTPDSPSYIYMNWYKVYANPLGIIRARYNTVTDFYVDTDYRGVKVRNYKFLASAYVSGAHTAGYICTQSNQVWLCILATSTTPSINGFWTLLSSQTSSEYPLAGDFYSGGFNVSKDINQYIDRAPFQFQCYTGTGKCNSSFTGAWNGFNLYVAQFPLNAKVDWGMSTANIVIRNVGNAELHLVGNNTFDDVQNTLLYSSDSIAYTISGNTFLKITSSILYNMSYSAGINIVNTLFAGSSQYNTLGSISAKMYNSFNNNVMPYAQSVNFKGITEYNNIVYLSAVNFNSLLSSTNANKIITSTFGGVVQSCKFVGDVTGNTMIDGSLSFCNFYARVTNNNLTNSANSNTGYNIYGDFTGNSGAGKITWLYNNSYGGTQYCTFTGDNSQSYNNYYSGLNNCTYSVGSSLQYQNIVLGSFASNTFANTSSVYNNYFKGDSYSGTYSGTFRYNEIGDNFNTNILAAGITEKNVFPADYSNKTITTLVKYTFLGNQTTGNKLIVDGLPTSAAGLPAGSIWNNSGVLTIV